MKNLARFGATASVTIALAVGGMIAAAPASAAPAAPTARGAECNAYGTVGLDSAASVTTQIPAVRVGHPGGTYTYNYSCALRLGANNTGVTALQKSLRYCHLFNTVAIDGAYGPNTETAVRIMQQDNGLTGDGIYGPVTRGVLKFRATNGLCYPVQSYRGF
jgi:peptidoglycan hydrolase-like protein with peptidoglycan-binding domain